MNIASEDCVVCCLDILGYKNDVESKNLQQVLEIESKIQNIIDAFYSMESAFVWRRSVLDNINIDLLGDAFIISLNWGNLKNIDLKKIHYPSWGARHLFLREVIALFTRLVSRLYLELLTGMGYLCRGGISAGIYVSHHIDIKNDKSGKVRNFISGQAFVAAYSLAEKTAIVPRVVIDKKFEELLAGQCEGFDEESKESIFQHEFCLSFDIDKKRCLDIYDALWGVDVRKEFLEEMVNSLAEVKKIWAARFDEVYKEINPSYKVILKFHAFRDYHNSSVRRLIDKHGEVFVFNHMSVDINQLLIQPVNG